MASEKWGEEPSGQLGVVQEELTRNNADIAQLEQLWAQDPHNPLFQRMYERLARKEQLLLEERKIWAGAALQNHSWQAGFNNSVGFRELLKRMAAACTSGSADEIFNFERTKPRTKPVRPVRPATSHLVNDAPGKQLLMLCEAAEATESYGQGMSEWRSTNPVKYTEPWVRDTPGKRKAREGTNHTAKRQRQYGSRFASMAYDGLAFEIPVRLTADEGLAAYVRAKLNAGPDESCTEREPPGLEPSLSDDMKGDASYLNDYLKEDYARDVSGGTKMSQQGNPTPVPSENGAVTMPRTHLEYYNARNGYLDHVVSQRQKPARSGNSGRSLRQNTHVPSRYDENQYGFHPT